MAAAPSHRTSSTDFEKMCKIFFNIASLSKCPDICWGLGEVECALAWAGLLESAYEACSKSGDSALQRVFRVRVISRCVPRS